MCISYSNKVPVRQTHSVRNMLNDVVGHYAANDENRHAMAQTGRMGFGRFGRAVPRLAGGRK